MPAIESDARTRRLESRRCRLKACTRPSGRVSPTSGIRLIIGSRMEKSEPTKQDPATEEDLAMLYCPVCSTRLTGRSCKLLCEKCGYYISCADYY